MTTKTIETCLNVSQIEDVVAAHLHAIKAIPDNVEIMGITFGDTIDADGVLKLTLETKEEVTSEKITSSEFPRWNKIKEEV